jgi:hypothetical protein
MTIEYQKLFAAFHVMLGRAQMSSRSGNVRRALLQLNCCSRIWERMAKTKY